MSGTSIFQQLLAFVSGAERSAFDLAHANE
jgi:hypothetical protein